MSLTSAASDDVCATRVMPSDELQEQPNGDAEGGIAPPNEQPHAGLAALSGVPDAPQDTVASESSLHQELAVPELTSYSGDESGGIALPGEQSHGGLAAEPSGVSDAPRDTVTLESSSLHQEPTNPVLSYSGGIALFDERRHTSPAAASCWAPDSESPSPIVTFAESEPYGGSTNGIMWECYGRWCCHQGQ